MTARSEVERVRRRIKSLVRRREHLADLLANAGVDSHRRHWLEAEHNALVWVLAHIERNKQTVYDEAARIDAARGWHKPSPSNVPQPSTTESTA